MKTKQKTKYQDIKSRSFETKVKLFLFSEILQNKIIVNFDDFSDFEINIPLVEVYSSIYYQCELDEVLKNYTSGIDLPVITRKTIKEISSQFDEFKTSFYKHRDHTKIKNDYFAYFENNVFPVEKYSKFWNEQSFGCRYCGIRQEQINHLINKGQIFNKYENRGFSLEIDRKNSNLEYFEDNCVWSCFWCNNAKTDEFTYDEFIEIGKAIEQVWQKRLQNDN